MAWETIKTNCVFFRVRFGLDRLLYWCVNTDWVRAVRCRHCIVSDGKVIFTSLFLPFLFFIRFSPSLSLSFSFTHYSPLSFSLFIFVFLSLFLSFFPSLPHTHTSFLALSLSPFQHKKKRHVNCQSFRVCLVHFYLSFLGTLRKALDICQTQKWKKGLSHILEPSISHFYPA